MTIITTATKKYTDGDALYIHIDEVIYLSQKYCDSCQLVLDGVVDLLTEVQSGQRVSFCGHCMAGLSRFYPS